MANDTPTKAPVDDALRQKYRLATGMPIQKSTGAPSTDKK